MYRLSVGVIINLWIDYWVRFNYDSCSSMRRKTRIFTIRKLSAHAEAGAGRRVIAYIPEMVEPELMYKLFDAVTGNLHDLVESI